MQELISINKKNGTDFVGSLRSVYENVGMDLSNWSRWVKKNIEENSFFSKDFDYQLFVIKTNGRDTFDYSCTLDMAKHLIVQMPTEKAHEYRQYLIDYEKNHKKENLPILSEMEMIIKIAEKHVEHDKKFVEIENKIDSVINKVTLESGKQRKIQLAVAKRVYDLLEFEYSNTSPIHTDNQPDYDSYLESLKRKLFSGIYRDIKRKFGVASYKDIKVVEYEKALNFIENWIEDSIC